MPLAKQKWSYNNYSEDDRIKGHGFAFLVNHSHSRIPTYNPTVDYYNGIYLVITVIDIIAILNTVF